MVGDVQHQTDGISAAQCRAARGLIGWSQDALADAAGLSRKTVTDFEGENRPTTPASVAKIEAVLRKEGVEFIPENGGGAGVRLRRRASAKKHR